jgi:YesN/AraC family two-component response regulator
MSEKNLLIIDDEELLLKNLKYLLKKYATNVFTAYNGKDGLELLKKQNIHCVICDISMPGMTGVEVIRAVREDGNEVPFIFYTAHGNHELMKEAAKYGAFDFLTKPVFEDLESVVSRGLSEGFDRASGTKVDPVNEYQKILDELNQRSEEES